MSVKDGSEKEAAREAFDQIMITEVYVFRQYGDKSYLYQNASKLVASDFDMLQDVYVIDKDFQWTYVYTHEAQCGPYYATK